MGNNSSGFENEQELLESLDGKEFSELNSNLRNFVLFINNHIPRKPISVIKIAGAEKCDLLINIDGREYSTSIKKGSGNSVHQEHVNTFVRFLKANYSISDVLANDILFFIWGDGTFDGSGRKEERMDSRKIAKLHPCRVSRIREFFREHKADLIKRFLLKGVSGNEINYIYYGDSREGLWASSEEVLNLLCDDDFESTSEAAIPIGGLTFQAWNRAIGENCTESTERKRGVIQVKWGKLEVHLHRIKSMRKNQR